MKPINICFITQIYDEDDPYRSNVVEWIRNISCNSKVNHLHIITKYKSKRKVGNKCSISTIQHRFKFVSLILFYREIFKQVSKKSIIFIHMGGPYGINLFLFKLFFNTKVYQWWAHPVISASTKIGFYLTIDKLFTCSESSFPINSKKKLVIGHGVNINRFSLRKNLKPSNKSLVTASRLTSRKNIHKMINLVQYINENNSSKINLDIYGSPLSYKDKLYEEYLIKLINKGNLENNIRIFQAVSHFELKNCYEKYNIYLNFSETALDKSVLEAMSTGIPILSCNPCFREIIYDDDLQELITFNSFDNINVISSKINKLLNLSVDEFDKYAKRTSQYIKLNHSIERLTTSIVDTIIQDIN